MIYELWDVETANMVGSYMAEAEAIDVVREAVACHGIGYVDGLALVRDDVAGESRTIADGHALLEYAGVESSLPTLTP